MPLPPEKLLGLWPKRNTEEEYEPDAWGTPPQDSDEALARRQAELAFKRRDLTQPRPAQQQSAQPRPAQQQSAQRQPLPDDAERRKKKNRGHGMGDSVKVRSSIKALQGAREGIINALYRVAALGGTRETQAHRKQVFDELRSRIDPWASQSTVTQRAIKGMLENGGGPTGLISMWRAVTESSALDNAIAGAHRAERAGGKNTPLGALWRARIPEEAARADTEYYEFVAENKRNDAMRRP